MLTLALQLGQLFMYQKFEQTMAIQHSIQWTYTIE